MNIDVILLHLDLYFKKKSTILDITMKIKTIISGLGNIGLLYDYNSNKVITHSKNIHVNNNFILCGGVDKKKKIEINLNLNIKDLHLIIYFQH